jgi:SAM-dependent methyltransferase
MSTAQKHSIRSEIPDRAFELLQLPESPELDDRQYVLSLYTQILSRRPSIDEFAARLKELVIDRRPRNEVALALIKSPAAREQGIRPLLPGENQGEVIAVRDFDLAGAPSFTLQDFTGHSDYDFVINACALLRLDIEPVAVQNIANTLKDRPLSARLDVLSDLLVRARTQRPQLTIDRLDECRNTSAQSLPPIDTAALNYRLDDLLMYRGRAFIRHTYRALLKREPDPEGLRNYAALLDSGQLSPAEMAVAIASSSECRSGQVRVDGIRAVARRTRILSLPVIGKILRILSLFSNLDRFERSLRSSQRYIEYTDEDLRSEVALQQLETELERLEVAAFHRRMDKSSGVWLNQLSQIRESVAEVKKTKAEAASVPTKDDLKSFSELIDDRFELQRLTYDLEHSSILKAIQALERRKMDMGRLGAALAALSLKADRSEISVVIDELKRSKPDRGEVKQLLSSALAGVEERKADRSMVEEVERRKAENSEMERLLAAISDVDQRKADLAQVADLQGVVSEMAGHATSQATREQVEHLLSEYRTVVKKLHSYGEELVDLERRLALLRADLRKQGLNFEAGRREGVNPEGQISRAGARAEDDGLTDALYASFEDIFRGTRSDIKSRQTIYLDEMRAIQAGTEARPILDVGCGRGEWLELLKENGLRAHGIDANATMVERCRSLNLDVTQSDALEYLRGLPASSVGAITLFQIIEHVPTAVAINLLDEVFRVLHRDGEVILETPNPANLIVGSCNFYMDPTHRNPIPSPLLKFIVEARGFSDLRVLPLHPMWEYLSLSDAQRSEKINQLLFGPQDYAVIGRK